MQLNKEVIDLDAIVDSAVEQSQPLLESRKHSPLARHEGGHPCVTGDRNRLVQIIVNLLNNAARYTPEGGSITLTVSNDTCHALVDVQGSGIGIEASLLPRIFDLFTQAQRTPARSQGGPGIGLALVKTLVNLHGGEISVASDGPGTGTRFYGVTPFVVRDPADIWLAEPSMNRLESTRRRRASSVS